MAQNSEGGSGATPWLAFLLGGLIVVVAVIGYFMYAGRAAQPQVPEAVNVDVRLPAAPTPNLPDAPKPPVAN